MVDGLGVDEVEPQEVAHPLVERLLVEQTQLEMRRGGTRVGLERVLEGVRCAAVIELLAQLLAAQEMRLALLVRARVARGDARARAEQEQRGGERTGGRKNHRAERSETRRACNHTLARRVHARGPD